MIGYFWPIILVVASNVFYQIAAKSVPKRIDPFASLTVTYLIGAIVSFILYYVFNKNGNIASEYEKLNWAPFILGICIIGLEVGFIYAYKVGWQVSTASIMQSAFLSIILIFIGYMFFKEQITFNKIIGVIICIIGLVFINK